MDKATGAVYRDYPLYLQAVQLLKTRVWGSVATGAGQLTYEEAAQADSQWPALIAKVSLTSIVLPRASFMLLKSALKALTVPLRAQVPASNLQAALQLIEGSTASLDGLSWGIADLFKHGAISSGKENETQSQAMNVSKDPMFAPGYIHNWICKVPANHVQTLAPIP